jgi:hypothetical protein
VETVWFWCCWADERHATQQQSNFVNYTALYKRVLIATRAAQERSKHNRGDEFEFVINSVRQHIRDH